MNHHPSPFGNRNRPRLSSFLSKNGNSSSNVGVESSPGTTQSKRRVSSFLGSFLQRNSGTSSINSHSYDGDESRSGSGGGRSTTSSSYFRTGNIVVELTNNNGDGSESFVGNGAGCGADYTATSIPNLNDSFRSVLTSPTVESSSSYISHPPTSTRQTRLRKLDVGGCGDGDNNGGGGASSSSCKRMSLRQAMLQRYNNKMASSSSSSSSSSGMVTSGGMSRRRSSALKRVPFGDDDSTLATEPSSMELSPTMSPASTIPAFHGEVPMSPELKKEMDEMDDVMRILKEKLGFKPVAIVGSRHESFSSLPPLPMMSSPTPPARKTTTRKSLGSTTAAVLPTITSDDGATTDDGEYEEEEEEEQQPQVVANEDGEDEEEEEGKDGGDGVDDDIDDDLKKEIAEMESIMLTMKEVLGFKPVAVVGSRHESFTLPSSKAMSRAARRVSSSSSSSTNKRRTTSATLVQQ